MALSLKAFLGLDASGFELGMKKAQSSAQKFESSIRTGVSARLAGFLSVAAIGAGSKSVINLGSEFADMASRAGTSTDAMQQWSYAAKQTGSDGQTVVGFFEKLGVAREDALSGNKEAIASFTKLSVTLDDLKNKRIEDIGKQIGNSVKSGDIQNLVGALRDVGGRGATGLVTAFKSGLDELFADAPLIKAEDIIALDQAGDAVDKFFLRVKVGIAPVVTFLSEIGNRIVDLFSLAKAATITPIAGLLGGKSSAEVNAEARKEIDKILEDYTKRNNPSAVKVEIPPEASAKEKKSGPSEKSGQPSTATESFGLMGASINSLQQIGARSGFNPMQAALNKNTIQLEKTTRALAKLAEMRLPVPGTNGNLVEY